MVIRPTPTPTPAATIPTAMINSSAVVRPTNGLSRAIKSWKLIALGLAAIAGMLLINGCGQDQGATEPPNRAQATSPLVEEDSGAAYDPQIVPGDFVAKVNNPFFPLTPGTTFVFRGESDGETERIQVDVTDETKTVLGVPTVVVRDRVWVGDQLVEDTFDWYAQDIEGNVWYFGETSTEYEDGVAVSTAGSWEAGVDGAKSGVIMQANPQTGQSYRQEYYAGEAEDMAEVISQSASVTVPYGSFNGFLVTREWTPLEPGVEEHKYYIPGIGVVLEQGVKGGSGKVVLVEVRQSAASTGDGTVLKAAKLIIEHNATDEDTGFQGFVDSEGWERLVFTGPNGAVLEINGRGNLGNLGLTELFFETVEPENSDVSIAEMLTMLPEGDYVIEGSAIEAGERKGQTKGIAWLTHDIPSGPVLLSPEEEDVVSADDDLVVSWSPVTKSITGSDVNIISYELIIQKDHEPHPHMIGKLGLDIYLPGSVTNITIASGFLEPGTDYEWEVLAIEESGNQTLSSGTFRTR